MSSVPHVARPPDDQPPRREPIVRIPPVTLGLIAINIMIQAALALSPDALHDRILEDWGFAPAALDGPFQGHAALTLLTYQFLHGGWEHLGINMLSLLAFGAGVETVLRRARYLVIYLLSGIAGALLEAAFASADALLIGASASISGVFGALLIVRGLYPRGQRFGVLPQAALWIALMGVTGALGVGAGGMPVAWVAHIGGFIAGLILGALIKPRRAPG